MNIKIKNQIKKLKEWYEFFYENSVWEIHYKITNVKRIYRDFMNATYHRLRLGFNPRDTWNLDLSIAEYILPRLKHYRKKIDSHPANLTVRQWERELDKMIAAFELIVNEKYIGGYNYTHSPSFRSKTKNTIDIGLDSFRKHYFSLWN